MDKERNLLFGVFGVQLRQFSAQQLMDVAAAWATDPSRDIPQRMLDAGFLPPNACEMLRGLVERAVEAHGGDAQKTLNAFGGPTCVQEVFQDSLIGGVSSTGPTVIAPTPSGLRAGLPPISAVEEWPGRYTHISEHGRGGFGRVLLVHDLHLDRDIALKELIPELLRDLSTASPLEPGISSQAMEVTARFLQEARITSQLEHPSIVPVYELGRHPDGSLYYTMRFVRGVTMSNWLRGAGTLTKRIELLPHFVDLCHAIAYAHARGVIHRDIKPSNVMIGDFGETVVLDWGLAKTQHHSDVHADQLADTIRAFRQADDVEPAKTTYGRAMGTPAYMPPEQAQGFLDLINEKSDIYSLGAVLYEILTGQLPFSGGSPREVLEKVVLELPKPIREIEPHAPPELVAICERAMAVDQERRYTSAKDLAEDVGRFLVGALVEAYRYTPWQRVVRFVKRHKAVLGTAAAFLSVLAAVGVYSYIRVVHERNEAEVARDDALVAQHDAQEARTVAENEASVAQIRLLQAYVNDRNFARANELMWTIDENRRNWEWGYLFQQCNEDRLTLRGHQSLLFSVQFSEDGQRLLTLAGDRTARVWDSRDGTQQTVIQIPQALIADGDLSPDGSSVLLALRDGTARIYDAATRQEMAKFEGHAASVNTARFLLNGSRIITASADGTIRFWDVSSHKELARLEAHAGDMTAAYASQDGEFTVGSSRDGRLHFWRAGDENPVRVAEGTLPSLDDAGRQVAFTQSGRAVAWDLAEDKEVFRSEMGGAPINRVRFSPRGARLLTASADGIARMYDVNSGALLASFTHGEDARDVQMSPDESAILVWSSAGLVTVWDVSTGNLLRRLLGHESSLAMAVFSPDSSQVATASIDHTAKIWDARHDPALYSVASCSGPIDGLSLSRDGQRVGLASKDMTVRVVDARTRRTLAVHSAFSMFGPAAIGLSTDGKQIATPLDGTTVAVLDEYSEDRVSQFTGHRGPVATLCFSPDDNWVASGGSDGIGRVWDAKTGGQSLALEGHEDRITRISYSPEGSCIGTASHDGTVRLWNSDSGSALHVLKAHSGGATAIAFSPDGKHLVSTGNDGLVIQWSVMTGERERELKGHSAQVSDASYSPDGQRIVSTSWDRTVRVWNAATGDELFWISKEQDAFGSACFSPDGQRLFLAGREGSAVAYWAAPWRTDQLSASAGGNTGRERFENARRQVLAESIPPPEAEEPAPLTVHTRSELLKEHLTRLREALDTSEADLNQLGPNSQGILLSPGPRANAMARLCLQASDTIAAIQDTATVDTKAALDALNSLLNAPATPTVHMRIVRDGLPLEIHYVLHKPVVTEYAVELSREDAKTLLNSIGFVLSAGKESLLSVNQDFNQRRGEPTPTREDLNGVWLPSGGSPQIAQCYKQLGLAETDHIRRINGVELLRFEQLVQLVESAERALEGTGVTGAEINVERGEFQLITLKLKVI